MGEPPWIAVPRLMDGIDAERCAMGKQGCPAVAVERNQRIPETVLALRQLTGPLLMTRIDRPGRNAVGESRRLGAEACALSRNLKTAARRKPVEGGEAQSVQHRREGCTRVARQRIPERQGAMGGQLGDKPFRQRL